MSKKFVYNQWLADNNYYYQILELNKEYEEYDWKSKKDILKNDGVLVNIFKKKKFDPDLKKFVEYQEGDEPYQTRVLAKKLLVNKPLRITLDNKENHYSQVCKDVEEFRNKLGINKYNVEVYKAKLKANKPCINLKLTEEEFNNLLKLIK